MILGSNVAMESRASENGIFCKKITDKDIKKKKKVYQWKRKYKSKSTSSMEK